LLGKIDCCRNKVITSGKHEYEQKDANQAGDALDDFAISGGIEIS
jgi:hypothetical protein